MTTTIVEVIELARVSVEAKHKNAALSKRNNNADTTLVQARILMNTMRERPACSKCRVSARKR